MPPTGDLVLEMPQALLLPLLQLYGITCPYPRRGVQCKTAWDVATVAAANNETTRTVLWHGGQGWPRTLLLPLFLVDQTALQIWVVKWQLGCWSFAAFAAAGRLDHLIGSELKNRDWDSHGYTIATASNELGYVPGPGLWSGVWGLSLDLCWAYLFPVPLVREV